MATAKQTKKTTVAPTTAKSQDDTAREVLDRKADVRRAALTTRQELRPAARSNKSREICNRLIEELRSSGIKGKNGSRQPWPSTPPCVTRSTSTASSAAPMPTDTASYFRA